MSQGLCSECWDMDSLFSSGLKKRSESFEIARVGKAWIKWSTVRKQSIERWQWDNLSLSVCTGQLTNPLKFYSYLSCYFTMCKTTLVRWKLAWIEPYLTFCLCVPLHVFSLYKLVLLEFYETLKILMIHLLMINNLETSKEKKYILFIIFISISHHIFWNTYIQSSISVCMFVYTLKYFKMGIIQYCIPCEFFTKIIVIF